MLLYKLLITCLVSMEVGFKKNMKTIFKKFVFCMVLFLPFISRAADSSISIPSQAGDLPRESIKNILSNGVEWLLGIFGIVSLIAFVVSGIMYLVSSGDDGAMQKAKRAMTYSIIGVIVGLSAFLIIQAVNNMLSVSGSRF